MTAPALLYAAQNEQGAQVLDAIGQAMASSARFDSRPPATGDNNNLKKSLDDLSRQFVEQREAFMEEAAQLARGGAFSTTPADLERSASELARLIQTMQWIDELPRTIDTLNQYKPRPFGLLDKRLALAAQAAAGQTASPARDDGLRALREASALADAAGRLSAIVVQNLPAAVIENYAAGKMSAVEAKWRTQISDQATALAAGEPANADVIKRLGTLRQMHETLRSAAEVEAALARIPSLIRWIDWHISTDQLRTFLSPYRDALAGGYAGYAADDAAAVDRCMPTVRRYRPVMDFVVESARHADACAALPEGLNGLLSSLCTPLDKAPYASERYLSTTFAIWAKAMSEMNDAAAREAGGFILRHLERR